MSQPSFDTPADDRNPLPGVESFKQALTTRPELIDVTTAMLLAAFEKKLCSYPKGSRTGAFWQDYHDELFHGIRNSDGTRDGNGVLRGFKAWDAANAATSKLKPLVLGIIKHFGSPTSPEEQHSTLEILAQKLKEQMDDAEKKKEEKANEKIARRIQNETVEDDLGFRATGHGVQPPSLAGREIAANETAALTLLARPTSSACQASAVSSDATTAAALSAILTPTAGAARSNAIDSALAFVAAGGNKTVKKSGPLDKIKNARNLDRADLVDGLESSLDRTSNNVVSAFRMFANSPNAKRQKTGKAIQERINLTLQEIKELKELDDPEFEADLKEAKDQLRRLYKERKSLNAGGVAKNLHCDLTMSDDE